jgi:hypothetical protein
MIRLISKNCNDPFNWDQQRKVLDAAIVMMAGQTLA